MKNYPHLYTKLGTLMVASVLTIGVAPAAEPPAAAATGGAGYEVRPEMRRYREMGELMEQMQTEMKTMSQTMAQPDSSPQERKATAAEMKRMSLAMNRMSGLIDRPSMGDAEARKQMDSMHSDMAAMQKRHAEPAGKK